MVPSPKIMINILNAAAEILGNERMDRGVDRSKVRSGHLSFLRSQYKKQNLHLVLVLLYFTLNRLKALNKFWRLHLSQFQFVMGNDQENFRRSKLTFFRGSKE
jgi:hypothetical protein